MKLTFLGTGTSVGVPMIGCECAVCTSSDPRNRRRRASVYIRAGDMHVIVDTTPDFREQALQYRIPRVDAILYTHSHADHIFGLDDIRRYNTMQMSSIPAYAHEATLLDLRRIFDYVEQTPEDGVYRPQVKFHKMPTHLKLGELKITMLDVVHGNTTTVGYLFEADGRRLGYVPDCERMPDHTVAILHGVDVMVLDALRHRHHSSHITVEQSVELLGRISAGRSYTTHMCHDLDHATLSESLAERGVQVSYDGLELEV